MGSLKYKMAFKDQGATATGKSTEDRTVTVSNRYYQDSDRDGYGNQSKSIEQCGIPSGYVDFAKKGDFDTDDSNPFTYPGAPEICDGKDNDGNGKIDDDPTDGILYYEDSDGDNHGNHDSTRRFCQGAGSTVTQGMSEVHRMIAMTPIILFIPEQQRSAMEWITTAMAL